MAVSSWMETASMAGKSQQTSHESLRRRENAGNHHTDKTVERKGKDRRGEGKQPLSRLPILETWILEESVDNVKLLERLLTQEHMESWRTRRSKSHLTQWQDLRSLLSLLNCI